MGWKENLKRRDESGKLIEPVKEVSVEIKPVKKRKANGQALEILTQIKDKRKKLGLDQEQMATLLDIARENYSRLESGSALMDINQLSTILKRLNLSIA